MSFGLSLLSWLRSTYVQELCTCNVVIMDYMFFFPNSWIMFRVERAVYNWNIASDIFIFNLPILKL